MEDLNSLEQQSFNVFIKFLEVETIKLKETMKAMDDDDVIAILTKKANIINMFSEDFDKYFKTLDIKDKYALSKLKFSNFNAELIDSFFFDYTEFFFKKKYNNYFKVRMHHFSKLLLFLSLGCRHNEMIKALFMHHSDLVIYNMSFIEENTDTQKQIDYKFPEKVYEYFDKIDKHIFNYKGPNSLLSKDPSTSFVMIDKASEDTNEYFTSISSP
jgi:hypothetical protein